jgi:RNA polymerase sigma-70 factor, ECF subfamily
VGQDQLLTAEPATGQDGLFDLALSSYAGALERLARAYETEPETRRDLLQEIHIALWKSFAAFDGRCSLRTWVYRVAHNIGSSHVARQIRARTVAVVALEDLEQMPERVTEEEAADHRHTLERLLTLIQRLEPVDRQIMLAYLEGLDATSTAEITGLSSRNVATRIHRVKNVLARQFWQPEGNTQ